MSVRALQRPSPNGLHAGAPLTRVGSVGQVYALVAAEMAASEETLRELLGETIPAVAEIGSYLAASGGKRVRPLLTALGARAVGFEGGTARLMCAGELVHLGSLLHDDVVDGSLERRGRATAQQDYGNPAVILTGDVCVATAMTIAGEEGGLDAVLTLAHTVKQMSEGEVSQLLHRGDLDLDLATYNDVIYKKSASLISWCVAAGARATGDDDAAEALARFGAGIGVAFQITDDVLDYTGDSSLTGKRLGQDLMERKITLPLLLAFERDPSLRARLETTPTAAELPALLDRVRACGAPEAALAEARARVDAGITALKALPDSPARSALITLAHYLVERAS